MTDLATYPLEHCWDYVGVGRYRRVRLITPQLSEFRWNEQFRKSLFKIFEEDRVSPFERAESRRDAGAPAHTWFDDAAYTEWVVGLVELRNRGLKTQPIRLGRYERHLSRQ